MCAYSLHCGVMEQYPEAKESVSVSIAWSTFLSVTASAPNHISLIMGLFRLTSPSQTHTPHQHQASRTDEVLVLILNLSPCILGLQYCGQVSRTQWRFLGMLSSGSQVGGAATNIETSDGPSFTLPGGLCSP